MAKCEACQGMRHPSKLCDGTTGELRQFESWEDLVAHLTESDIVGIINHHHSLIDEYLTLKDADIDRKARQKSITDRNRILINYAKANLDPDELQAIKDRAEIAARTSVETHHNGRVRTTTRTR